MKRICTYLMMASMSIISLNAFSQSCTTDANYLGANTLMSPVGSDTIAPDGQSFQAIQTGYLSSVILDLSATNPSCLLTNMDVRVDILDGDGIGGTQLASEIFTIPVDFTRQLDTFDFSMPAMITSTQMYTIIFTLVQNQDCGSGEPDLIWYFDFPTNFWTNTGGTQYQNGVITSLGNTQYFSTCVSTCLNTSSTITPSACDSLVSPSGNYTWNSTGIYTDTIPNMGGCDSVITVDLTINTVDPTVTNTSPSLAANASGATYQWLDCDNSFSPITGETGQNFTATANGNYAVEVTENGCVDTSACEIVANVALLKNSFDHNVDLYPNPTEGDLTIDLGHNYNDITLVVKNSLGQEVTNLTFESGSKIDFSIDNEPGLYFIELSAEGKISVIRVIKK